MPEKARPVVSRSPADPLNRAKSVLFLAPHPDDELFYAGLLAACRDMKIRFSVAWLTHARGVRAREACRAAAVLGLRAEDTLHEDLPDCGLRDSGKLLAEIVRRAVSRWGTDTVVSPMFEGGHMDHDALAVVAEAMHAEGVLPALIRVPLYHADRLRIRVGTAPSTRAVYPSLAGATRRIRLDLLRVYRSQWPILLPLLLAAGTRFLGSQRIAPAPQGPSPAGGLYRAFFPFQRLFCGATRTTPGEVRARVRADLP